MRILIALLGATTTTCLVLRFCWWLLTGDHTADYCTAGYLLSASVFMAAMALAAARAMNEKL